MANEKSSMPFKLYRPPMNIEVSDRQMWELPLRFPGHNLYEVGQFALNLIQRDEVDEFINNGPQRVTYHRALRVMLERQRDSARRKLQVTPKRLEFESPNRNIRRISLLVEDETGALEEEREKFLLTLGGVTGAEVTPRVFIPSIELGRASLKPSRKALESIADIIPDAVDLDRVRAHPEPKDLRSHRAAQGPS